MDGQTALPSPRAGDSTSLLPGDRSRKFLLLAVLAAQLAHLVVLLVHVQTRIPSNLLQLLVGFLAAAVCLQQATRAGTKPGRRLWLQLLVGFSTWTCAQFSFLLSLFGVFAWNPSLISNTLWLFFSFPLVLVASTRAQSSSRDAVAWLDTAQAFLFFGALYALVFPRPGIISLELAYEVQSFAMLLAVALSYSTANGDSKRELSRPLSLFVITYAVCSIGGYTGWRYGHLPGTLIDLCWSIPFTIFSVAVLLEGSAGLSSMRPVSSRGRSPSHLRGVSALGLAAMSLMASGVLAMHRTIAGSFAAVSVFLLFAVRTSTREWQLESAHEEQEFAALHDPLTTLANRRLLERELTHRLDRKNRTQGRVALLFIGLDRFKTINDGLGYAFGDTLLIHVGARLVQAVRPQDMVGRNGGDEFVILFDHQGEPEAEAFSRHINEVLREPVQLDGRLIHVTASIGLVLEGSGATAGSMFQDADCAMYEAKALGKDRAQTFAPNMLQTAKRRLGLETDLRASLALAGIDVHYQPIYKLDLTTKFVPEGAECIWEPLEQATRPGPSLSADALDGFEALARWRHPLRGMVSPADFIPIAEDTGLIIELGKQVLFQACAQCRAWNQRYQMRLTVSVNVSALQFAQPGYLDEIKAVLLVTGFDPCLLKLEITESVLLSGYEAAEEVLSGARALGIRVCLDDFGTGYSSLSYLLKFPFDVVKIDRSFIRQLDTDPRRAEMVRMVIELAATLNKSIVAEGMESPEELALLRELGCNMVQGFLLSEPLTAEAVELLLEGLTGNTGATLRQNPQGRQKSPTRPLDSSRTGLMPVAVQEHSRPLPLV